MNWRAIVAGVVIGIGSAYTDGHPLGPVWWVTISAFILGAWSMWPLVRVANAAGRAVDWLYALEDVPHVDAAGLNLLDGVAVDEVRGDLEDALGLTPRPPVVNPPGPEARGTHRRPCEGCGQTHLGNTISNGWYRCNECGYPGQ